MGDFSEIFDMEWTPAVAAGARAVEDLEAEYRALEQEADDMAGLLHWDNVRGHHLHPDDQKRLDEIEARLVEIEGLLKGGAR